MTPVRTLRLENIGQIVRADVQLADLTVLVGPQATGKSIFLQFLKLALDTGYVHDQLIKHGVDWKRGGIPEFLDVYMGEGMRGLWRSGEGSSAVSENGRSVDVANWASPRNRRDEPTAFYIPAQRVLSLANGWPRPFQAFAAEDPFAVRDFSETFRLLMEKEFGRGSDAGADLFPKVNRLKSEYRELLAKHLFGGAHLLVDKHAAQKRLVLRQPDGDSIPFMAWSAGQREFVPLLMGLYWLMPVSKVSTRDKVTTVIIEEPEMGLHPGAISAVMLLVLELLRRGYRVCISTHSPQVLDVVWAVTMLNAHRANPNDLLDLFETKKSGPMREVAEAALNKKMRVYYFDRSGRTTDISNLDPGSESEIEAGWGGLSGFSGRVNEVVSKVVGRDGGRRQ
jgi:hypothetical protein